MQVCAVVNVVTKLLRAVAGEGCGGFLCWIYWRLRQCGCTGEGVKSVVVVPAGLLLLEALSSGR